MYSISTHNGIITVYNPKTGGQRTFKIKTQKKNAKFAPGERIISLLTGPNNESDYRGFGFVKGENIILWKKNRTEHFEKLCSVIRNPDKYSSLEYMFEGKCRVCNRTLTDRDSINFGIGPVCRGE